MEDDRVQVDLGIAAEIEEKQIHENAVKQPKKRFVGRRAATEAAKSSPGTTSIEDSGAIQGNETSHLCSVERDAC
jgi:2-(3-amino-3-carboxypropyl)histidine synthase